MNRVDRSPGICGGRARISGTRIAVWLLESYRRLGASSSELLDWYPSLCRTDLDAAWRYVAEHRDEVEVDLAEQDEFTIGARPSLVSTGISQPIVSDLTIGVKSP